MKRKLCAKEILWIIVIPVLIRILPLVLIPEWRAEIVEHPLGLLVALAQAAVLSLVLLLGVHLLFKWVRAEKKEKNGA